MKNHKNPSQPDAPAPGNQSTSTIAVETGSPKASCVDAMPATLCTMLSVFGADAIDSAEKALMRGDTPEAVAMLINEEWDVLRISNTGFANIKEAGHFLIQVKDQARAMKATMVTFAFACISPSNGIPHSFAIFGVGQGFLDASTAPIELHQDGTFKGMGARQDCPCARAWFRSVMNG